MNNIYATATDAGPSVAGVPDVFCCPLCGSDCLALAMQKEAEFGEHFDCGRDDYPESRVVEPTLSL